MQRIRKRIRFIKNNFFGNTSACQIWTLEMSRWAKCIFPAMPRTLLEWTHSVLTQTVCETPTRASDMLLEPQPVESRNFRLLLAAFYFIEMFKSYFLIFFLKKKKTVNIWTLLWQMCSFLLNLLAPSALANLIIHKWNRNAWRKLT